MKAQQQQQQNLKTKQEVTMNSKQQKSLKVGHLFLVSLAVLVVVATSSLPVSVSASDRQSGETTIDRPTHRATSFVPRLGKREPRAQDLERALLCATYNLGGPDCDLNILQGAVLRAEQPARQQPVLALISALARGIPTPDGQIIRLVAPSVSGGQMEQFDGLSGQQQVDSLNLLSDLVTREVKREDSRSLSELLGGGSGTGSNSATGAKRVAFTPRIGR